MHSLCFGREARIRVICLLFTCVIGSSFLRITKSIAKICSKKTTVQMINNLSPGVLAPQGNWSGLYFRTIIFLTLAEGSEETRVCCDSSSKLTHNSGPPNLLVKGKVKIPYLNY